MPPKGGFLICLAVFPVPTANFYVDGFNLYYGSLKNRWPMYKWLDLQSFCERLASGREVKRIRYFTARVKNSPHTPTAADSQQVYLRALSTLSKVTIHYGQFRVRDAMMPLKGNPTPNSPAIVKVTRTEEKRSDVNLATWLLLDSSDNDSDETIVVSNDSDLVAPIEAVRERFHMPVGVINPQRAEARSRDLAEAATWSYASINRRVFSASQLPPDMVDSKGAFSKPGTW